VRLNASTQTAPTRDVNGVVHGEMRLQREGAVFQLRVRGFAKNTTEPAITRAVLVSEVRTGALP